MTKYWYNWNEMRRDVDTLCRDIVLDNFIPDVIVGIARGGLTPGVMMSHWFKKPFHPVKASLRDFPEWETYLPRPQDKKILIVDDICDSGETFKRIKDSIDVYTTSTSGKQLADVRFAALWWNNEIDFEPHYHARNLEKTTMNVWIQFPWDHFWMNGNNDEMKYVS